MSTVSREIDTVSSDDAGGTRDGTTGFTTLSSNPFCRSHSNDATAEVSGWRYLNITIEPGDTINTAEYSGYLYTAGGDDPHLDIQADDQANAPTWSSGDRMTDRTRTTAAVAWSTTNIGVPGYAASPDIATVVQEIVDLVGWSSGNPIALILWSRSDIDDRYHAARSQDFGSNYPKLDIDYTAGAAFVPYPRPRGLRAGMSELVGGMH